MQESGAPLPVPETTPDTARSGHLCTRARSSPPSSRPRVASRACRASTSSRSPTSRPPGAPPASTSRTGCAASRGSACAWPGRARAAASSAGRSARSRRRRPPGAHPNGAVRVDHVVMLSPDLDRTVAELESQGFDLRRRREGPTPGGSTRQAFFRAGEPILEVVQAPEGTSVARDPRARRGCGGSPSWWRTWSGPPRRSASCSGARATRFSPAGGSPRSGPRPPRPRHRVHDVRGAAIRGSPSWRTSPHTHLPAGHGGGAGRRAAAVPDRQRPPPRRSSGAGTSSSRCC